MPPEFFFAEVEENSELDLLVSYKEHANDPRIPAVCAEMAARGIPVACEVDIYGALSEYIGACVSGDAVTLLDINNSVPARMWEEQSKGTYDYALTGTFMGFHCGNTPACKLCADRAGEQRRARFHLRHPGR